MEQVLRELEGLADIVPIDAPPPLPVTDAAVLGSMTSGLLMVVRSNRTSREQVKRAGSSAHGVGATCLGLILDAVATSGPDAYTYGYGYGGHYNASSATGKLSGDESAQGRGAL